MLNKGVISARDIQLERFKDSDIYSNSQMSSKQMNKYCEISEIAKKLLNRAMEKLTLSARANNKILKIARTIAVLENNPDILPEHIA
jgi:magnesium chelatase family protein